MPEFKLSEEKSIASLLYICHKLGGYWDMYSLLKILYFAECKHLVAYGRPITGDKIIAMKYGPVPSFSYDKVKPQSIDLRYFSFEDDVIIALVSPNLNVLAESEIECLDAAISENKHLGFGDLKNKSHDPAYEKTKQEKGLNAVIPYLEIAKQFPMTEEMRNYITEKVEFKDWE